MTEEGLKNQIARKLFHYNAGLKNQIAASIINLIKEAGWVSPEEVEMNDKQELDGETMTSLKDILIQHRYCNISTDEAMSLIRAKVEKIENPFEEDGDTRGYQGFELARMKYLEMLK